jgi:hypothetical protein
MNVELACVVWWVEDWDNKGIQKRAGGTNQVVD